MAIIWGSWSSGQSGSKSRLGIDRSTSTTASQITVTIVVHLEFAGYYANNSGTLTLSGGHSVSKSVSLVFSGSGTRNLGTFTETFTRPYGSGESRSTQISVSGFAGGNPQASTTYTLPRRAYSTPAAPDYVAVTRVSDDQADVSWSVPSSTSAPVTSVEVIRRQDNGDWENDRGFTSPNRNGSSRLWTGSRGSRYRWAARGLNRDEIGPWGYTGWLYNRPNHVGNVSATRDSNDIVVSWVDRNSYQYGQFQIFDNGTQIGTVDAGVTTFTHVAPDPSVTHTYSVRAIFFSLHAEHVYSNTVQLLSAPLAPTNLNPDGGYVVTEASQRLEWEHNPVDSSTQKGYELRVRKEGGDWTTYTGTTESSRNITVATFAGHDEYVEWQVRTKGDHADYGPWSAVASFGVASRPTVTITAPTSGATISTSSVNLEMVFSRAPVSYDIEVRDSSNTVVSTISDYSGSVTASRQVTGLRNTETYTVRVTATDRVTSTVVSRSFTAMFAQPSPPTLVGEWDSAHGATHITVTPPAVSSPVPTKIRVERADGSVVTETPATGPHMVIDAHAPIDRPAEYRAFAVATVGADDVDSAPSEVLDLGLVPEQADFLTFGDRTVRVRYQPGMTRSPATNDLHLIDLDDGTSDPVAIFGPKERHVTAVDGLLIDTDGVSARVQAQTFRELATYKGLVLLRTIDAPPVWGVVSGLSQPRELWGGYQVSLTHTKAR